MPRASATLAVLLATLLVACDEDPPALGDPDVTSRPAPDVGGADITAGVVADIPAADAELDPGGDVTPDSEPEPDATPDVVADTGEDPEPDVPSCEHECEPDESMCTDTGAVELCVEGLDGCWVWSEPEECASGQYCADGACLDPTCDDGLTNGDETYPDCGGSCPPCATGLPCREADDCESGICDRGLCAEANCDDGLRNGDESDVDCGGSCDPCPDGSWCGDPADCESGHCLDGVCAVPVCGDGYVGADEECDDGNDVDTDECTNACTIAACGDGIVGPGEVCDDGGRGGCSEDCLESLDLGGSCRQLRATGITDDGVYLIDPDSDGPMMAVSLYCDMTTDGGGWTLTYIVRNDLDRGVNPYWPEVIPGEGTTFPAEPQRPAGFFDGPTLETRASLFDATESTEWRATQVRGEAVLFDVKSSWAGTTGIGLRCFATGQGACGSVTQTCSSSPTDGFVIANASGVPIAAGGTGYVCDVGWSDCSFCVDWSEVRTDSTAGGVADRSIRYVGDSAIDATDTQTYYWIR